MDAPEVSFVKMQGTGNDFVVIDNRTYGFSAAELSSCAAAWCARRYGVGADGLLALDAPETTPAAYRMHYANADGSRATMCGNGARCLFRFARQRGFEEDPLAFDTDAGLYRATQAGDGSGHVRLFVPDITEVRPEVALERPVPTAVRALHFVHTGTEHLVATVDDAQAAEVEGWGQRLRHDPRLQPEGANVNFLEIGAGGDAYLRTYEKGVEAETLSCGTGVLAAAVVVEQAHPSRRGGAITVRTWGGTLRVGRTVTDWGTERYLEGPAVSVFRGHVPRPDALSGAGAPRRAEAP